MHKTRPGVGGWQSCALGGEQRPQLCGPSDGESGATWLWQKPAGEENPWSLGGIWSIPIKQRGHTRHCGSPGIVAANHADLCAAVSVKKTSVPSVRTEEV